MSQAITERGDLRGSANQRGQLCRQVVRAGIQRPERREISWKGRSTDLEDMLGARQILEMVGAEISQRHFGGQGITH
jgi:hypothetical protein